MRPDLERMGRSCIGKKQYSSPEFAEYVAKKCERRGRPIRTYQCPACQKWHLTHIPVNGPTAVLCGLCMDTFEPATADDWKCPACASSDAKGFATKQT